MPAPKKSGTVEMYQNIRNAAFKFQENNDCAVVAATVATSEPYEKVHETMASLGRRPRKGTPMWITERTLNLLGFDMVPVPASYFVDRYPGKHRGVYPNVTTHHPERFNAAWTDGQTYLLRTSGHILAVRDGVNVDWTKGKACRVKMIYRVVKRG